MTSHDLIASVVAGLTSEFTVLPICTIQTVYQTQKNLNNSNRKNVYHITKDLYRAYGIRAFYNASVSAITSQMISTGSKFTLYKIIQRYRMTNDNDLANNIINGGMAGITSILFTQPFDVVKNYHQRQLSILSDIKKNPLIIYRGATQSITKSTILIASLYPVNDYCKTYIKNPALAALATTFIVSPIIHPFDLLKRRAMANEKLWMGFNPINYYRGLLVNLIRTTPHFIVTMVTIDHVKKIIDNKN